MENRRLNAEYEGEAFFVLAEADCLWPILVTRWRLRVKVNRLRVYIRQAVRDASELPVEGAKA